MGTKPSLREGLSRKEGLSLWSKHQTRDTRLEFYHLLPGVWEHGQGPAQGHALVGRDHVPEEGNRGVEHIGSSEDGRANIFLHKVPNIPTVQGCHRPPMPFPILAPPELLQYLTGTTIDQESEERGRQRNRSARARPPARIKTTHKRGRRGSIPEDTDDRQSLKAPRTFQTGRARTVTVAMVNCNSPVQM